MFVLCPHCEFLVGVDPRTGQPPVACPKCGQALEAVQAEEASAPVEASVPVQAPPDEEAPRAEPPPPAAPKLDAEAMIAAMAAKPRKSRAQPRGEAKPSPKPETPAPTRRKRAERPAAKPTVEPEPTREQAPPRTPTPSLATRVSTWWSARQQAKPKRSPAPMPSEPAKEEEPKRKASVRPIPSLRDRAAARAAAKQVKPVPEIEALSIGEAPAVVVEAPVVEAPGPKAPVVEAPVAEASVVEAAVMEIPVAEAPVAEAPLVAPEPPRAPKPESPIPNTLPARPAPSFLRTRTGPAAPAHWRQYATLGGLSLLLALQLLLAQRDALAADARWRPTIHALCTALQCTMPAWRDPDAFTMLSRDVRPHARAPGTLQIDASFRNDARWAQPWPRLVVSLSDVDGRVVGTRAFTAAEYLGAPPTQNTLASGQSAAVRLAVVEPAPGVVAFSFEFR